MNISSNNTSNKEVLSKRLSGIPNTEVLARIEQINRSVKYALGVCADEIKQRQRYGLTIGSTTGLITQPVDNSNNMHNSPVTTLDHVPDPNQLNNVAPDEPKTHSLADLSEKMITTPPASRELLPPDPIDLASIRRQLDVDGLWDNTLSPSAKSPIPADNNQPSKNDNVEDNVVLHHLPVNDDLAALRRRIDEMVFPSDNQEVA